MATLDIVTEGPVRDMILAINHYVSTGDHIGEGVAMEGEGGGYLFGVPYDPRNPDDRDDARRLRQRLAEIAAAHPGLSVRTEDHPPAGGFSYFVVHVRPELARRLAAELVRSSGDAGWGSGKPRIDKHFPDVRGKILSGEGA